MRLAQFILDNVESILQEWEHFARSLPAGTNMTVTALRNDAERMLRFVAEDMESAQTRDEQKAKAQGHGAVLPLGERSAAHDHGIQRASDGFSLEEMVAEYRGLRASIVRLWMDAVIARNDPSALTAAAAELTRFHESIDQILAESAARFTTKLERDRDLFLAVLGHDLRSPLQAISMSAEVLRRAKSLSIAEHEDLARRIAASSARAQRLVADLTEFARGRLGASAVLDLVPCNLANVVRDAVDEMRRVHPGRSFTFTATGDATGSWDVARIQQLASNLMANAVHHGATGEPIDVQVEGADEARIGVRNSGEPIPEEIRGTIFDPLRRGLSSGADSNQGHLGLGLFIARSVARQHGGELELTCSNRPTTLFTAHLPIRR